MAKDHHIAILMGQDLGYCRDVLKGIQSYAIGQPRWVFRDGPPNVRVIQALRDWKPSGVIAHVYDKEVARGLATLGVPIVNTTSTLTDNPFPLVEVDHERVGRMAAEYFLDRGFRNFGFFGSAWAGFSKGRERGFQDALQEHGFTPSPCYAEFLPRLSIKSSWQELEKRVLEWLKSLPKPVAILASNDLPAKELSHACQHLGLNVPVDVALLGVDNDEVECHLARPPLSSIALPAERVGYEAALMLDRMVHRRKVPQPFRFIPPVGVVSRQSTDVIAVEDPHVAKAVAFIRSRAAEGIGVDDVVGEVALSRRSLERRFRDQFDRSVLDEIRRRRVELAKELLSRTDLSMALIAERSGFSTPARFCFVFRQFSGQSPSEFRKGVSVAG